MDHAGCGWQCHVLLLLGLATTVNGLINLLSGPLPFADINCQPRGIFIGLRNCCFVLTQFSWIFMGVFVFFKGNRGVIKEWNALLLFVEFCGLLLFYFFFNIILLQFYLQCRRQVFLILLVCFSRSNFGRCMSAFQNKPYISIMQTRIYWKNSVNKSFPWIDCWM